MQIHPTERVSISINVHKKRQQLQLVAHRN